MPVQRLVDQGVGFLVVLATHVADVEQGQARDHAFGLGEERFQVGVLDLVATLELAHDQLGVRAQPHLGGGLLRREPQRLDQPVVLGDVVGRAAERAGVAFQAAAPGVEHGDTPRRRTGVSSRAAVEGSVKPLHR